LGGPVLFVKIFTFSIDPNQRLFLAVPFPQEGRFAIVTNVERDAMDAAVRETSAACRVRRSRVVLTPRCWRQALRAKRPRSDGGKKAGHRGEREVSRKAIAQGEPDVSG
jgi:hypothetical protein